MRVVLLARSNHLSSRSASRLIAVRYPQPPYEQGPVAFQCQALVTGPVNKTVGRHDGLMGITNSTDGDEILVFEPGHDLLLGLACQTRSAGPETAAPRPHTPTS